MKSVITFRIIPPDSENLFRYLNNGRLLNPLSKPNKRILRKSAGVNQNGRNLNFL